MLLLHQLASTIRRNVGSKALEMGANAVLAYRLDVCGLSLAHAFFPDSLQFDFEGEGGIIARGLGTACTIERRISHVQPQPHHHLVSPVNFPGSLSPGIHSRHFSSAHSAQILTVSAPMSSPPFAGPAHIDVDLVSVLNLQRTILKGVLILTISYLPEQFDLRVGGVVSARSVKLLAHKNTDKELRDKWCQFAIRVVIPFFDFLRA